MDTIYTIDVIKTSFDIILNNFMGIPVDISLYISLALSFNNNYLRLFIEKLQKKLARLGRISNVLGLREHKVRSNPLVSWEQNTF